MIQRTKKSLIKNQIILNTYFLMQNNCRRPFFKQKLNLFKGQANGIG